MDEKRRKGKRMAGVLYIIAGLLFIGAEVLSRRQRAVELVVGALFLVIGIVRIVRTRRVQPPA
jgi:uncharacterized membrane protein HdeD (DUF308 family)